MASRLRVEIWDASVVVSKAREASTSGLAFTRGTRLTTRKPALERTNGPLDLLYRTVGLISPQCHSDHTALCSVRAADCYREILPVAIAPNVGAPIGRESLIPGLILSPTLREDEKTDEEEQKDGGAQDRPQTPGRQKARRWCGLASLASSW
ncbi:hypothetical protein CC80DRAFT_545356 [Byssothecium circinans]|uniref:Uncharacterized protein n=1 Tax=Byssothecium circinans TaxID=147558 RepID=A0A6A5U6H8_9PLEO|nr:hypothetical protein CC80DRAFT_545356 [Byssothecium circinans]